MNYEDLTYFYEAAINTMDEIPPTISPSGWNQMKELDKALGVTEYRDYYNRSADKDTPMDEELKKLLVMLAGPHGKTILKAYRIRKGLK